jgi:alkylhydroperoxidase/carboxymuconolactone decarboxylase family protein YurZ
MSNIRLLELDEITDPAIRALIGQAEARGAPDPNFFRIMGHVPELCTRMYELWTESFNRGRLDHRLKELVRVKMSRYVSCQY